MSVSPPMQLAWHLRVALRGVRKRLALFLTSILILGAAIGVNTALFSLLYAVLLRPVPGVERAGELLRIRRTVEGRAQNQSYPDFLDVREQTSTLSGVTALRTGQMRLAGPPAELLDTAIVSANYFDVLGVRPALGRLFESADDRGPHPVAVLSHAEWQRRFGGDPGVLGRILTLNGTAYTIVGVAAAPFRGVEFGETTAVWVPISMAKQALTRPTGYEWLSIRRAGWLTFYGRRKPGVRLEAVQSDLDAIAKRTEADPPGRGFLATDRASMSPGQRQELGLLFGLLAGAAGLVLLIACGNIGNLLLARAAAEAKDIGLRLALGARRIDLLALPLADAILIGTAGGGLGIVLAPWALALLRKTIPTPVEADVLDYRVLAFNLAITVAAVLLFALAPAWFAHRIELKSGRGRAMRVWVAAQVALSLALVANGALVLGSMRRILAIDPGYRAASVVLTSMDLSLLNLPPERGTRMFADLIDRVGQLPGVRSVTIAKSSPAVDWSDRVTEPIRADQNIVAPGYFRTLGIPLVAGRDFQRSDGRVAIVSKAFAEKMWPGQSPIGQRVALAVAGPVEVVGVAADTKYRSVLASAPALIYLPLFQNYDSIGRLMVAVEGDAAAFKETLRRVVQQVNPDLPVRGIATLQEQIDESLWQRSAAASLLTLFGALALGLACAGIYGMVSYATAQQTKEIAIRMALGAPRTDVLAAVLGRTLRLVGAGIAAGLPLAIWARPSLAAMLYGVGGTEPLVFGGAAVLFGAVAVAAAAVPARRAAATDPALALRAVQ